MIRSMSISLRLAIWYTCISFCGIVIFSTIMWFVLGSSVLSWKDRTLEMRAIRVNNLLSSASAENAQGTPHRLNDLVGILPEGELIEIVDPRGRQLFPEPTPETLTLPIHSCDRDLIQNVVVHREYFRLLCQPIVFLGQPAYLLVPSSLAEDQLLSRTLTSRLCEIAPLLLFVSSFSGYILSRRSLRPVDAMTREAKSITAKDLSRRLPIPLPEDELRRLALEWNSLLDRIEISLKRIEQFTADASHELRSPIAFIRATTQDVLAHGRFDSETKESLQVIVEETGDAARLLDDLLLLARADADRDTRFMEPVPLNELLREVQDRFAPFAEAKGHVMSYLGRPGRSPILAVDSAHIRRVLSILVDNAIKFTKPGGRIVVSYHLKDDLRICISDNGIGIAAEHQQFVFDRFYQIDPARTGKLGSGLGLSIAKSLVQRYAGAIQMESVPDKGTAVTLILPLSTLHRETANAS